MSTSHSIFSSTHATTLIGGLIGRFVDAVCGFFVLGASYTDPETGQSVPRTAAFSASTCSTYVGDVVFWQRGVAKTFSGLVAAAADGTATLCTPSNPGGGQEHACTQLVAQYSNGAASCVGLDDDAWQALQVRVDAALSLII